MKKLFTTILIFTFIALGQKAFAATTWYACTSGGNWSANVWTSVMADQGTCAAALGTPVAGDTAILNSSSGNITVTAAASAAVLNMTGYTGTFAQGTQPLTLTGGLTLCDTSCTMTGTGNTNINGTETLTSNGKTWPSKLILASTAQVVTFLGNWVNTGLIQLSDTAELNFTTNETLTANGGITMSSATIANAYSAIIILGGGTWSGTGVMNNNLTLAGNVTISSTVEFGTGTLFYSSGTITTTGGTLEIGASSTLITAGMVWNNIVMGASNLTVTLGSNLTATGIFTINNQATTTFVGAYNLILGGVKFCGETSATIIFPAGQTIFATNSISITNSNVNIFTLKSGTASSPFYLVYTGPVANENINQTAFTDVQASGPAVPFFGPVLFDYYGNAVTNPNLTRTQGIVNVTAANINRKPINPNTGV